MTERDDLELLASFHRRLAEIEHQVPDPVAWSARRVRGATRAVGLPVSSRLGLAAVVIVLAIAVVAVFAGLAGLTGPTSATGSPALGSSRAPSAPPPSPSPGIEFGADELPTSIGGEPVLSVPDALSHVFVAKDATTFLVGGWLDDGKAFCPLPIPAPSATPVLLDTGLCGIWPALVGSPPYSPSGQPTSWWNGPVLWAIFLPGSSPAEPNAPPRLGLTNLAVALRVHTHDPSAASCPAGFRAQCEEAVVVDSIEWISVPDQPVPFPTPISSPSFECIPTRLSVNGASPVPNPCLTASWNAVLAAVVNLGYPVQNVTIGPFRFSCGGPFGMAPLGCPFLPPLPQAAYVTFFGTDKVAAVTLSTESEGRLGATVVAFEVPPPGWSMVRECVGC